MTCALCLEERGHAPDCPNVPPVICIRCGEASRTTLEEIRHADWHESIAAAARAHLEADALVLTRSFPYNRR